MYASLPLVLPASVAAASPSQILAMPKSSSLTVPSVVTNRFSGETSRWTIPSGTAVCGSRRPWACSRPRAACSTIAAASAGDSRPVRRTIFRTDTPRRYSIAMYSSPSTSPRSNTSQMLRCESRAAMRASVTNMPRKRGSSISSGRTRLTTTCLQNPAEPAQLAGPHLGHAADRQATEQAIATEHRRIGDRQRMAAGRRRTLRHRDPSSARACEP
jgi:hypothetical protein